MPCSVNPATARHHRVSQTAYTPQSSIPSTRATTINTETRSSASMAPCRACVRFAGLCWITCASICTLLGCTSRPVAASPTSPSSSHKTDARIYPPPLQQPQPQSPPKLESRYWHHEDPDRDPFFSSWQSRLPDDTRFTNMTIVGTHDTMAYNRPGRIRLPDISRTQYFSLVTQLNLGVRFIDIRMRHFRDEFQAHHGATFLHSNFGEVVADLCGFLTSEAGKRETIVMRLKRESGSWDIRKKNKQTWGETLNDYFNSDRFGSTECLKRIFYKRLSGSNINEWPTLGQARGKLLIIEDFELSKRDPKWPRYGPQWNDQDAMRLQDDWRVYALGDKKAKFESVIKFWRNHIDFTPGGTGMTVAGSVGKLRVNHVSGSGVLAWPINVASGRWGLNRKVNEWLNGEGKGLTTLGCVVEDFIDEEWARTLVGRNFGKGE